MEMESDSQIGREMAEEAAVFSKPRRSTLHAATESHDDRRPAGSGQLSSPLAKSVEIDSDPQLALDMAEQAKAFEPRPESRSKTPFPVPFPRFSKGRRQFSGLAPLPPRRSAPPPSSPFDPPPSAQPPSFVPSSTPIDVKRARKPLFFQEKPEDRESMVAFDSKLQAEKEERRRKELEVEQRRQDEWLEELLGHRKAEKKEVREERREVAGRQREREKAAIAKRIDERKRNGEAL